MISFIGNCCQPSQAELLLQDKRRALSTASSTSTVSPHLRSGTQKLLTTDVNIPIKSIRRDGGTQPRVAINQTTVEEYASDMREGASFPPVLLFNDGTDYWLADGFHRVLAAEMIRSPTCMRRLPL